MLKPFVKWAGGKKQLIKEISQRYPDELGGSIHRYVEPFVGGGAVLFDILNNYEVDEIYISDANCDLINTYQCIKDDCTRLIMMLSTFQNLYIDSDSSERDEIYYDFRNRYNYLKSHPSEGSDIERAALFIFLNKTCFNGLYRVNRSGEFNVPTGRYVNPKICDEDNLSEISKALQKVNIRCGRFDEMEEFIDEGTFVYFDPPYRPLTDSASFNAYTKSGFNDKDQTILAELAHRIDKKGAKFMLSNSDPHNSDPDDDFFDELYQGFDIERVGASRAINSKGSGRGKIDELLIRNYR